MSASIILFFALVALFSAVLLVKPQCRRGKTLVVPTAAVLALCAAGSTRQPVADQIRSSEAVQDLRWRNSIRRPVGPDPALLFTPDATNNTALQDLLTRQRNDRPVVIPE